MVEIIKPLYGPRKIGDEAFAAQQAAKKLSAREGVVYGKRKADNPPAPTADATQGEPGTDEDPPAPPLPKFAELTLDELELLMLEQPALLDEAIKAECADGTPRKGAIALFLEVEDARAEGPRTEVVTLLKSFQG